nr:ALF repeat-containing protein [Streptomyces halobius]
MQAAGGKALVGTAEDVRHFLEVGQYEARAKDKAAEDAAKNKPSPGTGDSAKTEDEDRDKDEVEGKDKAEAANGGKDAKHAGAATGDRPKQISSEGTKPAVASSESTVTAPGDNGELAGTGAGSVTSWAVGGTAIALRAGAGLVIAGRRRASVEH